MTQRSFTVIGGGPVGTLLAISLARHGYRGWVSVEMREPGGLKPLLESVGRARDAYGTAGTEDGQP